MQINKKIIATAIGAITLAASVAMPAFAEESSVNADASGNTTNTGARVEVRAQIKDMRTTNKSIRASTSAEIKAMRDGRKNAIGEIRDDIKGMRNGSTTPEKRAQIKDMRVNIKDIHASSTAEIKAIREGMRLQLEEKRKTVKASVQAEIANFKEGKKVKLDARKKENVEKVLANAFRRLTDAITRLGEFDKKVSEAIANRKAKSLDTTAAESTLVIARQALEEAKVDVEAINAGVSASVNASTTATTGISKEALKESVRTAMEAIKITQSKYKDVIEALPKVRVEAKSLDTTAE